MSSSLTATLIVTGKCVPLVTATAATAPALNTILAEKAIHLFRVVSCKY
jgi:hypothetical protein